MKDYGDSVLDSMRTPPRVAVVGGGIAGLTCARELSLRGCDPVVFEADDRLGGRCSSRSTRLELFDDGAQYISGATRLAAHVAQLHNEPAALHAWTVAATPAEDERIGGEIDEDFQGLVLAIPAPLAIGPQRWFVEADERWSLQHEYEDAETVADQLLAVSLRVRSIGSAAAVPTWREWWPRARSATAATVSAQPDAISGNSWRHICDG